MKIDNIVVASDLSEHCGAAARWAQSLKETIGGRVVVEHVIEISVSSWLSSAYEILDDEDLRAEARAGVVRWYQEHTGVEPDAVLLRAGSCLQQLTEAIEEMGGTSLLVVSMSGKGAFERFLVGSTAQTIAGQPPAPVVVVHPDHDIIEMGTPIVTGTDFSRNADKAIRFAVDLGRALESPLSIIHANAAPTFTVFEGTPVPPTGIEAKVADLARAELDGEIARISALDHVDYTAQVVERDPADALLKHAADQNAGIIVVGHSGETPFVQNFLGSVAQKVLKHMDRTLVIIPPASRERSESEDE